ncbi:hypothetical protein GOZ96_22770 [Agrobacterium vitis]|uniref:Uncharacterized protein n=1 Tax=Agrobacterium vitis TaxID=373 RepID=A0A7J4X2S7_AGRVI|nr:hypothetical protein [Agrobacterium vitis]KAA3526098.1 hypothetical protein DXT89_16360 [Agrobacterium vitis]MUZ99393.1 hypothetical protein [Agrobacterium vitis]
MSIPLSENPAVTNPRKALTPAQQDALCALQFFKFNTWQGTRGWQVGNKRISLGVASKLEAFRLIRRQGKSLSITVAGELAIEKLQGKTP